MAKHMKDVVARKVEDNIIRVPRKIGGAGVVYSIVNDHACVTVDRKKTANKRACRKRVRF